MSAYLALGLAWLLLTLPISVFIGKCISVGQAGEAARHAAVEDESATTCDRLHAGTIDAEDEPAISTLDTGAFPSQRRPEMPAAEVSWS